MGSATEEHSDGTGGNLKDTFARSAAAVVADGVKAVNTRIHNTNHEIDALKGQVRTQESTILNLTARLLSLESKVFPRCNGCGQLLPESPEMLNYCPDQGGTPKRERA
jgi:hypothetical protein